MLGLAAVSQATVIISNYPQTNDTSTSAGLTTARIKALGFIMPNQDYFLDSVTVRLQFTATAVGVPIVTIREAGIPTAPGAILTTLTAPGGYVAGAGNYTFTSAGSFLLAANTKYWVAVAGDGGAGLDWRGSSPAITPTGLATHDGSLFTSNSGTSWSNSATLNTYEINATAVPEPATMAALGLGAAAVIRRRRRS